MKIKNEYVQNAAKNIAHYYEKEAALGERMRANFSELASFTAAAAAKDVRTREFFASGAPITSYFEGSPDVRDIDYGALAGNSLLVGAKLSAAEAVYYADFCLEITECLKTAARLKPSPLLFAGGERKVGGRVAFTESNVIKAAFSRFAKKDSQLTASFVSSFTEACEDTAAGLSDYCILPIENTNEGLLSGVYSLIDRYELFITGVCEVETESVSTKFALLCRQPYGIIDNIKMQSLTLRVSGGYGFVMSKLYIGADLLAVEMKSAMSVPLGYTDGYAHLCTFVGSSERLFAFLLYLGVMRIGHTIVGAYEII